MKEIKLELKVSEIWSILKSNSGIDAGDFFLGLIDAWQNKGVIGSNYAGQIEKTALRQLKLQNMYSKKLEIQNKKILGGKKSSAKRWNKIKLEQAKSSINDDVDTIRNAYPKKCAISKLKLDSKLVTRDEILDVLEFHNLETILEVVKYAKNYSKENKLPLINFKTFINKLKRS